MFLWASTPPRALKFVMLWHVDASAFTERAWQSFQFSQTLPCFSQPWTPFSVISREQAHISRMPPSRSSRSSIPSHFKEFITLSAHERAHLAVSHFSEVTFDDATIYFNDTIRQEVAAMGFDLSEPMKNEGSEKYMVFRCCMCSTTRRPEQFWNHFFSTRQNYRCAATKESNAREHNIRYIRLKC